MTNAGLLGCLCNGCRVGMVDNSCKGALNGDSRSIAWPRISRSQYNRTDYPISTAVFVLGATVPPEPFSLEVPALLVAYLIIEPLGLLLVGSIDEVTVAFAATNVSLYYLC